MNNKKVYIAGSLFNEAEIDKRLKEEKQLREIGFSDIYNPINAPCNDKARLPTAEEIFWGDTQKILEADVVVADLSNPTDLGVACELGIIFACNYINRMVKSGYTLDDVLGLFKEKKLVAHLSDIRKATSSLYDGNNIPWGFNQFEIGMVKYAGVIKDNFAEVLEELKRGE